MLSITLAALAVAQFSEPSSITRSLESHDAVDAADLDGDGRVDLVVASAEGDGPELGWFRQLSDGAFEGPRAIDAGGARAQSIDAVDVDGDGTADLVLVVVDGDDDSRVLFLRGLGGAIFAAPTEIDVVGRASEEIEVADVDGDGDLDLLVPIRAIFLFRAALIENVGGGSFAPPVPVADLTLRRIVTFDADGDGDLDLIGATTSDVLTYRNDGPGGFVAVGTIAAVPFAQRMRLADLDGDGRDDLVVLGQPSNSITTYRSLGGFDFQPTGIARTGSDLAPDIDVVDVDRDGRDDVVVAPAASNVLRWLPGAPGATLLGLRELAPSTPATANDIATADVNGDGALDMVLARRGASLAILDSDPSATGAAFAGDLREVTGRLAAVEDVVALDVDGDGDRDVLGASVDAGLVLARGVAFEGFEQPVPFIPSIDGARRTVRADVDGDGREDVLLEDRDGRLLALWNEPGADLALALIDGAHLDIAREAVVGDLEADGDLDVFVVVDSGQVEVYEQTAPRVFAPRRSAAVGPHPIVEFVAVDADLDGDLDLVALENQFSPFRLFLRLYAGGPAGTFTDAGEIAPTDTQAVDLAVLRTAANSRPSFVWGASTQSAVDAAHPVPGGGWARPFERGPVAGRPVRVVVGDLNGAGSPDLVVRSTGVPGGPDGQRSVLEVITVSPTGAFLTRSELGEGSNEDSDLEVIDLDGDLDPDVIALDPELGRISWYANGDLGPVGAPYCGPAVPNSTGLSGRLLGAGSDEIARNDLALLARLLPPGATALFLVSSTQDLVPMAGGGVGTLCLGGAVGRFLGPGGMTTVNGDGAVSLQVDLTALPSPVGPVAPLPGSTWSFQTWYRDLAGGVPTSNLTNGLAVVLR